jgi:hypothetical protein
LRKNYVNLLMREMMICSRFGRVVCPLHRHQLLVIILLLFILHILLMLYFFNVILFDVIFYSLLFATLFPQDNAALYLGEIIFRIPVRY